MHKAFSQELRGETVKQKKMLEQKATILSLFFGEVLTLKKFPWLSFTMMAHNYAYLSF